MAEGIDSINRIGAAGALDDRDSGRRNRQRSDGKPAEAAPAGTAASADASGVAGTASAETLEEAVQQINEHLALLNRTLELGVDADTGLTVAMIRNAQTGELLQQIPAESSTQLAQMLSAWSHGDSVLLDLTA